MAPRQKIRSAYVIAQFLSVPMVAVYPIQWLSYPVKKEVLGGEKMGTGTP